jgi:hypothetical protein
MFGGFIIGDVVLQSFNDHDFVIGVFMKERSFLIEFIDLHDFDGILL